MSDIEENPWKEMKESPDANGEYILEKDRKYINEHKLRDKLDLKLHLYPEPFIGNPKAPIYLLNLNPGYSEGDEDDMPMLKNYIFKNYRHECPFYYLIDELKETNGAKWWRFGKSKPKLAPRLGKLIAEFGGDVEKVARSVFCIEYFPYHSKKFSVKEIKDLPSQTYSKHLIEKAIREKEDTIFIIMRKKEELFDLIPELEGAESAGRVFRCFSSQNPCITEENIAKKEGFSTIVDKIKKVV